MRTAVCAAVLLAIMSALPAVGAEEASVLLQKGVYLEETKGDIDGAIGVYKQVVETENANRKFAAEAGYRLGKCLLRKGDTAGAVSAFRSVVASYPEQAELAARAAAELRPFAPRGNSPRVVATSPEAFATDVDPATDKITVTFDRPMMDGSWSWTGGGDTFPAGTGAIIYDETKTTCTRPAKLEPGKVYWVGINSPSHKNFKTSDRVPAKWYVILFATRTADGKPMAIPEDMLKRAKAINAAADAVEAAPTAQKLPRVIETSPAAFATDIDPATDTITAVFDQPMDTGGCSWTFDRRFPFPKPQSSMPQWNKAQTATSINVKLEPGSFYWVGINNPEGGNFRSSSGARAQPYVILFATKDKAGNPAQIPDEALKAAKAINDASAAGESGAGADRLREPQEVGPAPWVDGELMKLSLKMKTGVTVGTIIYTAQLVPAEKAPEKIWRIESYMVVPVSDTHQFTRVDAAADTFLPIFGRTKNQLGDFTAQYNGDTVTLEMKGKGNTSKQDVPVTGAVYDNEEALYLIRRLALKEGFAAAFQIFPPQSGQVSECRIKVVATEKVLDRQCMKVVLQAYHQGAKILEHYLWFSADEHRYIVKYDAGTAVMELEEAGTVSKAPQAVKAGEAETVTLPVGWFAYLDAAPGEYRSILHIVPPQMDAWAVLMSNGLSGVAMSSREIAEKDAAAMPGYFENYKVRQASWAESKVDGRTAATYTADYMQDKVGMVEYRTYIVADAVVYWFVFRVEKEKFEAMKPQFDAVVSSLRITAKKDSAPAGK